ncbi:MAG: hypothetical protein IPM42_04465 [Saprospiraceae bacterium]|nr:hypothetical protein [Saprospiraceae bacterium]
MTTTENNTKVQNWNKPAYIVFIIVGLGFILMKDFSQAVIFMGLALVFDPFDIETAFQKRPFYQRAWLIVHLIMVLVLFGLMISGN